MIIKPKDPKTPAITQLETLLQRPSLPRTTVNRIKQELRMIRSGEKGEKDSAYYLDFHYGDKKNWAVIHDLRLEYQGRVAQIDHLLINRFLEFYVLETKHYTDGLKISDEGDFMFWHHHRYQAIESPLEQNKRHVLVLEQLLAGEDIMPKRLGLTLRPTFKPYILVSPTSRVIRPKQKVFNTKLVIKSDRFFSLIKDNLDNEPLLAAAGALTKVIAPETLHDLAARLAKYHRPLTINYAAKFGLPKETKPKRGLLKGDRGKPAQTEPPPTSQPRPAPPPTPQPQEKPRRNFCFQCQATISNQEAHFCFQRKKRFGGRAYCRACQKGF